MKKILLGISTILLVTIGIFIGILLMTFTSYYMPSLPILHIPIVNSLITSGIIPGCGIGTYLGMKIIPVSNKLKGLQYITVGIIIFGSLSLLGTILSQSDISDYWISIQYIIGGIISYLVLMETIERSK